MKTDIFRAIADPTRREIILLLSKKELTLNGIAENFNISRPAVSMHVKLLEESGLVQVNQKGRERYCRMNPKPLKEVYNWLEHLDKFWDQKLSSLRNYVENKNER